MEKIFIPVAEISVVETEISVTGLRPAFSYEHIAIFTKEIGVRRDLGNRASPVNRAHMKRPLLVAECHKIQSFIYFRESRFDENQNLMSLIQSIVSFYNIHRGFIKKQ